MKRELSNDDVPFYQNAGCLYDSVLQNSWKDLVAVNPHIKHPNGIKIKALILTFNLEKRDQCLLSYFTIR